MNFDGMLYRSLLYVLICLSEPEESLRLEEHKNGVL